VAALLQGNAETVRREVNGCISVAGKNTLIAAGCEVPAATPEINLLLMDKLLYHRIA